MSSQVGLVGLLLQAGGMSPFRFGPLGSNLGWLIDYPTCWMVGFPGLLTGGQWIVPVWSTVSIHIQVFHQGLLVIQVDPKVSYFLFGLVRFSVYLSGLLQAGWQVPVWERGVLPSLGSHPVSFCPCFSPPVFTVCQTLGWSVCWVDLSPSHCVFDVLSGNNAERVQS